MRKLTYHVASTLDGFICRRDGSFDFFSTEGSQVDDYLATLRTYDTVLMGRRTYEPALAAGVSDPYPWLKTCVFTRTPPADANPRIQFVRSEAAGFVRSLKAEECGPIYLCGGAALASTLLSEGLVDEILVKLNPILLGDGVPLAPTLQRATALELRSTKVYANGVVLLQYAVGR